LGTACFAEGFAAFRAEVFAVFLAEAFAAFLALLVEGLAVLARLEEPPEAARRVAFFAADGRERPGLLAADFLAVLRFALRVVFLLARLTTCGILFPIAG
jgi:hypothetical protein